MKHSLVRGAGGSSPPHLVKRLKREGWTASGCSMQSDLENGVNMDAGNTSRSDELVQTVAFAGREEYPDPPLEGPVGVQARNFRADRIAQLGWTSKTSLRDGIAQTYPWVEKQVQAARAGGVESAP